MTSKGADIPHSRADLPDFGNPALAGSGCWSDNFQLTFMDKGIACWFGKARVSGSRAGAEKDSGAAMGKHCPADDLQVKILYRTGSRGTTGLAGYTR